MVTKRTRTPSKRARSALPATLRCLGPCDPAQPLEVTLVLRRRRPLPAPGTGLDRATFATRYGAAPADVARVQRFAKKFGLEELACDRACRAFHCRGSAASLQDAFQVQLAWYQASPDGPAHLRCTPDPTLPGDAVIAVLGLDRRPVAHPLFRFPRAQPQASYTPPQLGTMYAFPPGDGSGQTIAIIELGGGYQQSDLDTYFQGLGIATPAVTVVSVDGGSNQSGSDADAEVELDIEVAGALAPLADFQVYFATNTDAGFYNAISQAAQASKPATNIMSISWGGPEDSWTTASRTAMEAALADAVALGVSVTVAAGDSGSSDGEADGQPHVDYPASSPSVLGCGGTTLVASGGKITSEVVWNDLASGEGATGGGVSAVFAKPAWQSSANVPASAGNPGGRGVPDVAGNADPGTGYQVLVDGADTVIGGTSAVAPLWAALIARLNQQLGKPLGFANPALYRAGSAAFRDITKGNNGAYRAGPGWDACTGLGSPFGTKLLAALGTSAVRPAPAHTRPGRPTQRRRK